MDNWSRWLYEYLGMSHTFQYKVMATFFIGLALYVLRRLLTHFLLRNVTQIKTRYNWTKTLAYTNYFLFFIIISPIWIVELQTMGTFLGLLSAGLAVALKDPISNLFAWIFIVVKRPFEMGDRIQVGDSEGDIIDIGFFEFTMLEIKNWVQADQSTGRIVHIPNGLLFTQPIVNYNQAMNYIWNEIPLLVTFESNWQKAKKILLEVEDTKLKGLIDQAEPQLDKAMKSHHVHYSNISPTVYTNIRPNGILLTLRYLCNPRKRRDSEQTAIEEILIQFEKCKDIEFAYPTTRIYSAPREGKNVGDLPPELK